MMKFETRTLLETFEISEHDLLLDEPKSSEGIPHGQSVVLMHYIYCMKMIMCIYRNKTRTSCHALYISMLVNAKF